VAARFTQLVLDCADPGALATFWSELLGYRVTERKDDGPERYVELTGPDGSGPTLFLLEVREGKTAKNRMHIDVTATDRDQDAEVERAIALGAVRVDIGQGELPWVVLADPEGNEFCVMAGRADPLPGVPA
jgi:catechol 2,3-dioxygenase-like lactoylglutathione lyase family enzyme